MSARCCDSRGHVLPKLLPSAALLLEADACAAHHKEKQRYATHSVGMRWIQTHAGAAQRSWLSEAPAGYAQRAEEAAERALESKLRACDAELELAIEEAQAQYASEVQARARQAGLQSRWRRDRQRVTKAVVDRLLKLEALQRQLGLGAAEGSAGWLLSEHDRLQAEAEATTHSVEAGCAAQIATQQHELERLLVEPEAVHARLRQLGDTLAMVGPGADPTDVEATAAAQMKLSLVSLAELRQQAIASGLLERVVLRTLDCSADLQGVVRMEARVAVLKLEIGRAQDILREKYEPRRLAAAEARDFKEAARWGKEVQSVQGEVLEKQGEIEALEMELREKHRSNKAGLLELVCEKQAENGHVRRESRDEAVELRAHLAAREEAITLAKDTIAGVESRAAKARALRQRESNAARRQRLPLQAAVDELTRSKDDLEAGIGRAKEALDDRDPFRRLLQSVASELSELF